MTEKPTWLQLFKQRQEKKPATPKQIDEVVSEFDYTPWAESEMAGLAGMVEPKVEWKDIPTEEIIVYQSEEGK